MKYLDFRWLIAFFVAIGLTQNANSQETYLIENFENETFPPSGWVLQNNGTGHNWTRESSGGVGGSGVLRYKYDTQNDANTWLFTSPISLDAGTEVRVMFKYKVSRYQGISTEKLRVKVGTDATVAAQETVLFDETLSNETYQTAVLNYTVNVTDNYYFAWNCYSNSNQDYLYVDDILIVEAPDCPDLSGLTADNVTIHTVDLQWNALDDVSYEYVLVDKGELPSTGTVVSATDTLVTVTDLEPYHEYDAYIRSSCDAGKGMFIGPVSFQTEPLCPHITELSAFAITYNSAFIKWEGNGNDNFQYVLGDQGFDVEDGTIQTTSEESIQLTGLLSTHTYDVYVRSTCNDGDLGIWQGPLTIVTTPTDCNVPNTFTIGNITANTADVEWSAAESIDHYEIVYGISGFNHQEATPISVNSTETSYTLDNLTLGTTYDVYLRTVCENGNSLWLEPQSFTTNCQMVTEFPYVQTFDDSWGCWSKMNFDSEALPWIQGFFNASSSNPNGVAFSRGNSSNYLISPQFAIGENMVAHWKYAGNSSYSKTKYVVAISTEGSNVEGFVSLDTVLVDFTSSSGWKEFVLDLRPYNGQNVYLSIYTISASSNSVNLYIDDFTVENIPACYKPKDIVLNNMTGTSLSVSWNAWLNTNFEIEYGTVGFTPTGTPNIQDISGDSYTIENLDPSNSYDIYLRAKCSDTEYTDWVGPVTFDTECNGITTFPYVQNFNQDEDMWVCWTIIDADNDGKTWAKKNTGLGMEDGNYAAYGQESQDDYLITPQINVGENYLDIKWVDKAESSFWGGSYRSSYTILVSTTGNNIEDFTDSITSFDCTNADWLSHTINLENYRNQSIYIAFHQTYSQDSYYGFGIDSLKILPTPPCGGVAGINFANITASSAQLSWNPGQVTSWDIAYGIAGTEVTDMDSVLDVTNYTDYTLNNLVSSSNYDVYIRQNCSAGEEAEWTGPFSFSTLCGTIETYPYEQNFDLDNWLCWTVIDADNDGVTWKKSQQWLDLSGTNYAAHGTGNADDYLITPELSINEATLLATWFDKVESVNKKNTYTVLVSTTGNNIEDFTDSITTIDCINTAWEKHTVNLSAYANQTIYIAFHQTYSAATNYGFGINDFKIDLAPTCPKPEELVSEARTSTTLTVDWEETGSATAWDFKVFTTTAAEPVEPTHTNITDKPYTISGLSVDAAYKVKVRAHCSDSDQSEWSDVLWTQTTVACPKPDGTSVDGLTTSEAIIKWNGYDGTTFDVELRLLDDPFTGDATHTGITTDSLIAQGLQHSTIYKYRVRNICDPDEGAWSDSTGFVTLCGVSELPFFEDFQGDDIMCWTQAQAWLGDAIEGNYSNWLVDNFTDIDTAKSLRTTIYSDNNKEWVFTPAISLEGANQAILEFDIALTKSANANPIDGSGEDDKFVVLVSASDDEVWTQATALRTWDNQGSPNVYNDISNIGEHIVIDLSAYVGSVVKIAFYAESKVYGLNSNNLYVDNVSVKDVVDCATIGSVSVASITSTTALVDWESMGSASAWDIKIVNTNTNDEAVVENVTEKPYQIQLEESTTYEVSVRGDCSPLGETNTQVTDWSTFNPTFTTLTNCALPSDIEVVQATATGSSVNVVWNGYTATKWDLEWVPKDSSPTGTPAANDITETSYTIDGLDAQTEYDLYLRADCDNEESEWVGPITFGSGCEVIDEFPWEEKFENWNDVTACWDLTGGTKQVSQYGSNAVKGNYWSWSRANYAYLTFPAFDMSALEHPYVEFTWSHLSYESYPDDRLELQVSQDGIQWVTVWEKAGTELDSDDGAQSSSPGSYVSSGLISLADFGNTPALRFYFHSGYGPDCFVGDVSIKDIPCAYPNKPAAFDVLTNTASVTWGFVDGQTEWEVQYGDADFELGQGTVVNADNDTLALSGLTSNTQYDAYVRSVCATDNYSDWIGPITFRTLNDSADFISFTVQNQVGDATIDLVNKTIDLQVTHTQSLEDLIPVFDLSYNAKVKVGDDVQVSGQNTLGFTSPIVYTVTSEDSSTVNNWTVTITKVPLLSEANIVTFEIEDYQIGTAVIDTDNHTVKDTVDYQANLSELIAAFTISPSASIAIGTVPQVSGVTVNDFSSLVTYTVTAEDGSTQDWDVTLVKDTPSDSTDILTFKLNGKEGVVDSDAHTVTVDVDWDYNLASLRAEFTLSEHAIAKIGAVQQYSGAMYNSYYDDVVYTVVAENGTSSQDWTVMVNRGEIPQGALCSNPIPLSLDAENITGTTGGFGNNYQYNSILNANEIIYQINIEPEDGRISGVAEFTNDNYGSISIYNGVPGAPYTECLVSATGTWNSTSCEFNNVHIVAGTYYVIISRTTSTKASVDYKFSLSYEEILSDEADILSYSIDGQVSSDIITEDKKVKVVMPYGTDLSNLVAEFTLSEAAIAKVADVEQISGTTANNWAEATNGYISYSVTAEDNSTIKSWKVYVTTEPNTENDILTYTIPEQVSSEINTDERKVTVVMPAGNPLIDLVPEFTLSDEATAKVSGVLQVSGQSALNWNVLEYQEYVVSAGNGDSQTWKVYVENAPNSAAEIEEFKLIPGVQVGTTEIDSEEAKILVEVSEQADITDLIIFKLRASEGATVTYQGNEVVPQSTSINLLESVILVVTAEDGTIKEWEVTRKGSVSLISSSAFSVYPNPTTGVLNIRSDVDKAEWLSIEVVNTSGQIVKRIAQKDIDNAIDLSEQANGLYLIKVNTTKGNVVKKINLIK